MKKIIAGAAAAFLVSLGLVTGLAAPASAHTGDLNASASCNTETGQYDVTYSLTVANSPLAGITYWKVGDDHFEGTPQNIAGLDRGPLAFDGPGTITLGTIQVAGDATSAPWAYAYTTWSDQYGFGSDGGDIELGGDCIIPTPEQPADLTTYTDWVDGTADCDATEVIQTRTKSFTTYTLVDNAWVANEPVLTTEEQTRTLGEDEITPCPTEVPPTTPPTTVTPTPTPTPTLVTTSQVIPTEELAHTGAPDATPYILTGFAGLILGVGLIIWALIKARRQEAQK